MKGPPLFIFFSAEHETMCKVYIIVGAKDGITLEKPRKRKDQKKKREAKMLCVSLQAVNKRVSLL